MALSFGHLCSDMTSGAVLALLPFLVVERGYTYGTVGIVVLATSIGAGVIQPVFGHFGEPRATVPNASRTWRVEDLRHARVAELRHGSTRHHAALARITHE